MTSTAQWLAQTAPLPIAPIPTPPPAVPMPMQNFGNMIVGTLKWILLVCGVGGFLACGIMITIGRRHRNQLAQQGVFDVGYVLLGLAVGSLAAVLVGLFTI